ncbi:cobalt ECF transporter T component CbiQ [Phaeobacter sp.]|uniref:cobalt ECF transporter T component CbiQ n=1 Tax=Phaeobacter sp. TaxID=1902409 RepID=UPI0025EAB1D4|nr:cobalt ECF transporter T component CbiQ [Phaeobacter sp.]
MVYVLTERDSPSPDPLADRRPLRQVLVGLDPRLRICAAVVFAVTVVAFDTLWALAASLVVSLALLGLSGLALRQTLKRMLMMDSFIIFMLVLLPFTMPGTPIFSLWGLQASWEGVLRAVEIGLTANAVILAVMTLVGSMEPVTLGHALFSLKVPASLVHLLMFTIRYIDVLREEYQRLRIAMKLRGFRPGTNWHTYRSFGYLVGMMLVRAIERSERILAAMKCRGFTGRLVLLEEFRLRRADLAFAVVMGCVLLALILVEVAHGAY